MYLAAIGVLCCCSDLGVRTCVYRLSNVPHTPPSLDTCTYACPRHKSQGVYAHARVPPHHLCSHWSLPGNRDKRNPSLLP